MLRSPSCTTYFCAWLTRFALCLHSCLSPRVLTPCLFLTPPDNVLLSESLRFDSALLGQCAAYKNNCTRSCLYLVSHLHWAGKAGILPRETSPVSAGPTAAVPTGASLTSGQGNVSREGGSALLLPSSLACLTSKPAFGCRGPE